ncbi:MAG: glycosyltransferase family 4 protein [Gemmatimonadales bacterium]|jgi:glycosyltransferase involved in cell wall biosynthesis
MRPTLSLAAHATPRAGGQGVNLWQVLTGLSDAFQIEVYAAGPVPLGRGQVAPPSRRASVLLQIPVARRRRDLASLWQEVDFDRWVSRRVGAPALFHGATGQSLRTLRVVRARGGRTVLDVVNLHADVEEDAYRRECAAVGVRSPMHPQRAERVRLEYREADLIRVMSERARRTFLERGMPHERLVVVAPHYDLAEFPGGPGSPGRFRISCVGAIEPWKGFRYLLDAYRKLALRDAELVFWGGTTSRPVARMLGAACSRDPTIAVRPVDVRVFGYDRVYGASSILVHPSLTDGFAFVVAEAMASGIPVIVSDRTGAADLVEEGRTGFVVPAGDAGAIAERLEWAHAHDAVLREMGQRARAAVGALTLERFRSTYVPRLEALL